MTIGVCDDEREIRTYIAEKIRLYDSDINVVLFESGEKLVGYNDKLDILFLDIQMSGTDGIKAAEQLRAKDKSLVIIFVTALTEYVYRAFDVGAFNYILKPIDKVKFYEVLNKAVAYVNNNQEDKAATEENDRVMLIHSHGVHTNVRIDDIVYAEVLNRKVTLHMTDDTYEYYGKLSDLEALAGDSFFRVHRAYLINMKYVRSYNGDSIRLTNGNVQMSKAKYKDFVKAFLRYTVKE
ncbi:MAG: response regulator transcription factor [Lachnospiraceae bacterium]|nr:response regulator transcription factor [Lachnospiraceae bacterium]